MTYGDGVGDVDVKSSIEYHRRHGKLATMTAVQPPGRYGALQIEGDRITSFLEKPQGEGGWVNAGFFVLSPKVIERIEGDPVIWERDPLESLAADGELRAWQHRGFWRPMDTLRDKQLLDELWDSGRAPWKSW
jgi:glucose-1-phosphate cytidylyltransferase